MSSFTMMMLEEGVEVELPADLSGVITILDQEVPHFSCEGHTYSVTSGKGRPGKSWELMIKSVNHNRPNMQPFSVGRVQLEKLEDGVVQLRIPPRREQDIPEAMEFDPDGRVFGSFVYHTLNMLQRHKLLELPGELPII